MLRKLDYLRCIPTRGTEVPSGPDWFHEIKHDGYRLIVHREGKRVRLCLPGAGMIGPIVFRLSLRRIACAFAMSASVSPVLGTFRYARNHYVGLMKRS